MNRGMIHPFSSMTDWLRMGYDRVKERVKSENP